MQYGFLINTFLIAGLFYVLYRFHKLCNNGERATIAANHDAKLRFLVYVSRKLLADLYSAVELSTLTGCPKMYLRDDGTISNVETIMKGFQKEYNAIITRLSPGLKTDYMHITKITVKESADGKEVSITVHWANKYADILVFSHNHLQQAVYQLNRLSNRLSTFGYTAPTKDMYQL